MPVSCCAPGCTNRHTKGSTIKFYRIPRKNVDKRANWIIAIGRQEWDPSDHDRICSKHFVYGRPSQDPDNVDFVPTIFSFCINQRSRLLKSKAVRYKRAKELEERQNQAEALNPTLATQRSETPSSITTSSPDINITNDNIFELYTQNNEPSPKRTKIFFPRDNRRNSENATTTDEFTFTQRRPECRSVSLPCQLNVGPQSFWQESMLADERAFVQFILKDNWTLKSKVERMSSYIVELESKVDHQRAEIERLERMSTMQNQRFTV